MTPSRPALGAGAGKLETLVIGYGNELRGDDGVGPYIARALAERQLPDVLSLALRQLVPELTEALGQAAQVILVDAALDPGNAVVLRRLDMDPSPQPLGHTSSPQELLALTQALFGRCPAAWLLTVPVVCLDFGEELSPPTRRAAASAVADIARLIASCRDP